MLKILDFPTEIIDQIIPNLSRKDMAHCLRVNKRFYEHTIDEFYSSLKMKHINIINFIRCVKDSELKYDPNLPSKRNLIKYMEIDFFLFVDFQNSRNHIYNLEKVFSISSGLTCLDISNSRFEKLILRHMLKSVDTRSLPHLQQIITNDNSYHYDSREGDFYNLYFSVCCKFNLSITHLQLWDFYEKYRFTKKEQEMVYLDRTHAFKKLSSLVIFYPGSKSAESMISSVIFSVCPGLTHFFLACGSDFQSVYDRSKSPWETSNSKYSVKPHNPNQSNLKVVHLQIKNMNTACIESIYSNIPTAQLDKFILELEIGPETIKWLESTQIGDLERLLQYLKKAAKQFELQMMYSSDVRAVSESERDSLFKLWEASNSCGEVKPRKEVFIDTSRTPDTSTFINRHKFILKLENGISRITQTQHSNYFFRFIHPKLLPDLLENVDRMTINLSGGVMYSKLNYLIRNYSDAKILDVIVPTEGKMNQENYILCKKSSASVPKHLTENGVYTNDSHYSPIESYMHFNLLSLFRSNVARIETPHKIDTLILWGMPMDKPGDYHFQFKVIRSLRRLLVRFSPPNLIPELCPNVRCKFVNLNGKILVEKTLNRNHYDHRTCSKSGNVEELRYTFSGIDFDRLSIFIESEHISTTSLQL